MLEVVTIGWDIGKLTTRVIVLHYLRSALFKLMCVMYRVSVNFFYLFLASQITL